MMKHAKTLSLLIGLIITVKLLDAIGSVLLTQVLRLNSTFASTGIGHLFSTTVFGVILTIAVFYAVYKGIISIR